MAERIRNGEGKLEEKTEQIGVFRDLMWSLIEYYEGCCFACGSCERRSDPTYIQR